MDKVYYARIEGKVTEKEINAFAQGLDIQDEDKTLPARLEIIKSGDISEVNLTIQEGRFHQVKRMFKACGMRVCYLKRISMGPLILDETLERGTYRALTKEELERLC